MAGLHYHIDRGVSASRKERGGLVDQRDLFIPDPVEIGTTDSSPDGDLRARSAEWIAGNVRAWNMFKTEAIKMANYGRPFSAKSLAEKLRWERKFKADPKERFKVPNAYVAYLARRLVHEHPELVRLLVFKETKF